MLSRVAKMELSFVGIWEERNKELQNSSFCGQATYSSDGHAHDKYGNESIHLHVGGLNQLEKAMVTTA